MKPIGDLKTQSGAYAIGLDGDGIIVTIPERHKLLVRTEDRHARLDITPMGPLPNEKYVRSFRVEPVKTDVPRAERAVNLVGQATRSRRLRGMWRAAIAAGYVAMGYNGWQHHNILIAVTTVCVSAVLLFPPKRVL